jgi:hypothetical protein
MVMMRKMLSADMKLLIPTDKVRLNLIKPNRHSGANALC